ncbi:MAG: TolC family protein, partial [Bacteroidetes bacterium]|nr:TolC family protein [Bacteroidota bacterium]
DLTLDKALEIALRENSQVKMAQMEHEKAESRVAESYSSLYPNISTEATYLRNIKKPVFFLPDFFGGTGKVTPIEIGSDNSYVAVLQFGVPLFMGQIYSGIVISKLGIELSNLNFEETLAQVKLNTTKAFYDALLTRESEIFVKKSYENALKNLENAEKMNKAGLLSDFEYLSAQVEVEKLKPTVLQSKYNYQTAVNFLKILLNLDVIDQITLKGSLNTITVSNENITINENIVNNTYSLSKLGLQKQIADKNIMLQKWGHMPSLTAYGNYQIQTQADDFNFNNYNWVKSSSVGLTLSIPIFSGFGVASKVEQAEISSRQLEETINMTRKQLQVAITNVQNKLSTASEKIESQKLNKEKAQKSYKIAEVRYKEGLSIQLEISNANINLLSAELGYASTVYEYNVAAAELEFYLQRSFHKEN